jgi:ABC-type uncharacterized transport system ATPase subunit
MLALLGQNGAGKFKRFEVIEFTLLKQYTKVL